MSTIHVPAAEGRRHPMIDGDHIAKVGVEGDGGAFEVFEVVSSVPGMAPPHVSPWSGVLYLLEGRVTALVDGQEYDVEPGDIVVFAAGVPSTFGVVGESARFLAITTGFGAGKFFEDFSRTVPTDRPPEDSMDAIVEVTRRHGVAMAGA